MKINFNFVMIICTLVVLLGGFFMIEYYFKNLQNQCLSSPLTYGAKQMEKQYGYPFFAFGYFKDLPINVKQPTIFFNSTEVMVEN